MRLHNGLKLLFETSIHQWTMIHTMHHSEIGIGLQDIVGQVVSRSMVHWMVVIKNRFQR